MDLRAVNQVSIMSILFKYKKQLLADKMQKIVGIFSGKGGAGKTTCAVNLGLAIHELGEKIILMDCDINNANLALHFGLYNFPITLHEILDRDINILEAVHVHSSGLRFIPASIAFNNLDKDLNKLRESLKNLNYYILIDAPSGIGSDVVSLIKTCDEILVVTNPDVPAITDALKIIQVAMDLDRKEIGIIINKSTKKHSLREEEIEEVCKVPILGIIPEDNHFKMSLHEKTPIILRKPYSKPAIEFRKLGANLLGKNYSPPKLRRLRRVTHRLKYK